MFSKEDIKNRWSEYCAEQVSEGKDVPEAGLSLASLIASSALMSQKQRSGDDYISHPITVGMSNTKSENKRIIGVLHDVVEDSDWTLDDLRDVGFSERVVNGVDGVTKRPGELYFDFVERCSTHGIDAIDTKIEDLEHNSQSLRYPHIDKAEKHVWKEKAYNISYYYLVAIKKGDIEAGSSVADFMQTVPAYAENKDLTDGCLQRFSSANNNIPPKRKSGNGLS